MGDRLGQQLGNYRLIRKLGQGGFAEVYLGEHLHLKTRAAVKILDGKLTERDVQAFKKEAQTIAALKHPHILRVLDFGFDETIPFLVMEYASQGTLRDRHPHASVLSPSTVATYIKPIAAALQYAHTMKVIHRDVKPENILIDDQQTLLLSDFGIAALSHSTASMKTVDSSGTPHYMAPEQFQGKPCEASDQYALAIIVYEWLTGQLPFRGDTFFSIGMQHLSAPVPPLSEKNPEISRELEQIVSKALAKDPKERFYTVQDFAVALEQTVHFTENSSTTYVRDPFDQQKPSVWSEDEPSSARSIRSTPLPLIFTRPSQELSIPSNVGKTSQIPHFPAVRSRREPSANIQKRPSFPQREQRILLSRTKNLRKRRLLIMIGLILALLGLILVPSIFFLLRSISNSSNNIFQMDATVGHSDSQSNPSTFLAFDLQGTAVILELPGGDSAKAVVYAAPELYAPNVPVTLRFQDVTGDNRPDMIVYSGSSKIVFVNDGTRFVPPQTGQTPNQDVLPGPVSSNVQYPVSWTNAVVGHNNDSPAHPSSFLAINLRDQIIIFEFPGGDPSKVRDYIGPDMVGPGADQFLVTLSFSDINHDGKTDMTVHISDRTIVFYNNGTIFMQNLAK
jgi:serine/threonine protein kinase